MNIYKSIFTLLLLAFGLNLLAQNISNQKVKKIDNLIDSIAKIYDVPGLAIGIVNHNSLLYSKYYGLRNIKTRLPVNEETIFRTESITKVFTTIAIMQLAEKGILKLADPVSKHLSYFKLKDTDYKKITIHQILKHKSGLPDLYLGNRGKPNFDNNAIQDYIQNLYNRPLEFEPGEDQSYNNTGFVILAALVEELTNLKFEDYMYLNILEPAGMVNSTFDYNKMDKQNSSALHVIGKDFQNEVIQNDPTTRWIVGAGGLVSTINDMCLFSQLIMNRGKIKEIRIISEESINQMITDKNKSSLGLTWNIYSIYGGHKMIDHGGSSLGSSSELAILPNDSLALIVFCNNRNGAEWLLTDAIFRILLDKEPKQNQLYPTDILQRKLREEGIEPAMSYISAMVNKNKNQVSPFSLMLFAYRLVQAGCQENLIVAKEILELLEQHFSEIPILHNILGEVYCKLAKYQFEKSKILDENIIGTDYMLNELKKIDFNSFY